VICSCFALARETVAQSANVPLQSGNAAMGSDPEMEMNPYFSALNYPLPKGTMMVMLLSDFQAARSTRNFLKRARATSIRTLQVERPVCTPDGAGLFD